MDDKKLTLVEYLKELRNRIIKSVIFIIIASFITYNFIDKIIQHIARPVERLVFIAPHEAFISSIKIAFYGGIILSAPFVIYQIWRFISAGLKKDERRYALIFGPLSFIFFIAGSLFGYFIIVPIGMRFLLSFATDIVVPMITMSKYISFVGSLTLAFALFFELPLASLFLTKIGMITPQFLTRKRKYAVVGIFILAAIATPPDVVTQCLMALPLLVLYEIGIIFSRFAAVGIKERKR